MQNKNKYKILDEEDVFLFKRNRKSNSLTKVK